MKNFIKELIPYVLIVLVVVLIRTYIATPVIVSGDSMVPTLEDGNMLLLDKISYRNKDIKRFDIVVIKASKKEIIKRVIGLPGEVVEYHSNTLYINGHEVSDKYAYNTTDFTLDSVCNCEKIPDGKYLVLGDNRVVSADSRIIGLIDEKDILGKVNISLWPIKKVS